MTGNTNGPNDTDPNGDRNDDRDTAAPSGPPPKSHEHAHGENMTNGIPDQTHGAEATGLPHGDREAAETAAGGPRDDARHDD